MLDKKKINNIYKQIQNQLSRMIPEKWEKIYLYASVIDQVNNLQTGEMFFYYFPTGLLKKKPVNVYEISNKFNIDEESYMILVNKLYKTIQELRNEFMKQNEKLWTNLTISIEKMKFAIEYNYDDLLGSKYSSYDRHIIWKFKYLQEPIEKLTKKDQIMLREYIEESKTNLNKNNNIHTENLYSNMIHNNIEYKKENEKQAPQKGITQKNTEKYEIKDKYEIYKIMQKENQKNKSKTNDKYIQYKSKIDEQKERILKIEQEKNNVIEQTKIKHTQNKENEIQEQVDENKNQILNFMN